MLVNIIRWFCGYVSFKAVGGFPENFLNRVNKKGINLWDLKKFSGDLYAKVLTAQHEILLNEAKKENSEIKIIKKYGFPVFLAKYKGRLGALLGVVSFVLMIHVFSLFIWSINVSGNKSIPSEEIVSAMKEFGVGVGTKKSAVDSSVVKQLIMSKLTDISWISLNIKGSCLNVCIKEKIKSPEIVKEGSPCNLVATSEGQIERMEVYKGSACVSDGDAVIKGQILISGATVNETGGTNISEADGKVFAKTKRKLIEKVKLRQLFSSDDGKPVKKYKINIFEKEIPLNPWVKIDEEYRTESYSNEMNFFGVKFPVIFNTDVCFHQKCEEKFLNIEEANEILKLKIDEKEKNEFAEIKILSKNVNNYEEDNDYVCEVTYDCLENIAKKQNVSE